MNDKVSESERIVDDLFSCDRRTVTFRQHSPHYAWRRTVNKKAQLTLTNPRDAKACKNCSNSTCFVSIHRIPFQITDA